jgi:hypothetical protein
MNSNYIWESYWKGRGAIHIELMDATLQRNIHNSGEIFEYLIDGAVVLSE